MRTCTIFIFDDKNWLLELSRHENIVGISLSFLPSALAEGGLLCLSVSGPHRLKTGSGDDSLMNIYSYLLHILHTCRNAADTPGPRVIIATDSRDVSAISAKLVDTLQKDVKWSAVYLDIPHGAYVKLGGAADFLASDLLHKSSKRPEGRIYSLSRAYVNLAAELAYPSSAVNLLLPMPCFEERSEHNTPLTPERFEYTVNGDNWHAPGKFGLYPSRRLQLDVEAAIAGLDNLLCDEVLAVAGGIGAAFDLVCHAFGLENGHALLVGPVYVGIEQILLLRNIAPQRINTSGSISEITDRIQCAATTRVIILTHPSLFLAEDQSCLLSAIASKIQNRVLIVVDECYTSFLKSPHAVRVENILNSPTRSIIEHQLLVGLRSLSKLNGLAGLRLAYTVSNSSVRARIHAARQLKSVSVPVLTEALEHLTLFDKQAALRRESRLKESISREIGEDNNHHIVVYGNGGPYLVFHVLLRQLHELIVQELAKARIYVNSHTSPLIIYQPSGTAADAKFAKAFTYPLTCLRSNETG